MRDTLFLLNPKANYKASKKMWDKIYKKYSDLPKNPVDITKINLLHVLRKKKYKLIVIAGGDGTINHVVSNVSKIKNKPDLAIIPMGFGNALSYCLGVETVAKALDVIRKKQEKITIDIMKTNIPGHERGVFNISIGFDAKIIHLKNDFEYIGMVSYLFSTVKSFFSHTEKEITFIIDHSKKLSATASSLSIANCPILGQNYVISPTAKLDDGLLDCTLFSTKYAYLTNLRLAGFKHPLYTELGKVRFKASHVRIEGEPFVQVDGDPVIQSEGIEIEIMKSHVTFLRNSDNKIKQVYRPFVI